ncbi:hypothetical protein IL38_24075 [Actinopolyspora erythraea]|uniref:Minor tail protein n=2 Tax=Actinopolyspora erythraea TaxID=414996 RepID=A0ABR4WYL1_9ACTN|nr:hypothetical protein IL38_24075 [Actinopolyspora erythraea]
MTGRLGCATRYNAVIHLRGGRVVWTPLDPEGITDVSWGRTLGDYSEASVTVAKQGQPRECLRRLADVVDEADRITPGVHCWSHELSIYRDGGLVWQGPVWQPTETRSTITIDARDVLMWNDRQVLATTFSAGETDAGWMLRRIMTTTYPQGSPNDPNIAEHWRIDAPAGRRYALDEAICAGSTTVGKLVRDVCKVGVDQFTLGRKIYMVPSHYRTTRAPYRLHEDDVLGDLEVREGGGDMATEGYAYGKEPQDGCAHYGLWPPGGFTSAWFGRVTKWRESTDSNDPSTLADMARASYEYGWPPPKAIVLPDGARLAPTAPVSIGQLVPGRPFQVSLPSYVLGTHARFRLNEVEVSWAPPEPEAVQVSLVTLNQPPEEAA